MKPTPSVAFPSDEAEEKQTRSPSPALQEEGGNVVAGLVEVQSRAPESRYRR